MPARSSARRAFLPDSSASKRAQVDQHQVVVGAARHQPQAVRREPLGERGRVAHDLRRVVGERRGGCLGERHGLGGDDVIERPALEAREHGLVDDLGELCGAGDGAATRAPQGLVRGEGHDVGPVLHRVGVHAAGDQPGDVGRIEHEGRADLVGDVAEGARIDDARVGGGARDDELRAVLEGEVAHLVEVDALVAGGDAVGLEPEQLAAGVDGRAVREVAALVEAQPEHGVAGLQQREVDGHVGVGARVRLHVGVGRAEELLGALDGERPRRRR